MSVYFIACGGFIKVGFSNSPQRRTANLFRSSSRYSAPRAAYEARGTQALLRAIDGDKTTEYVIHEALSDFRAGCEWFVDEPAVRGFIATVEPDAEVYPHLDREGGAVDLPPAEWGGRNAGPSEQALAKQQAKWRAEGTLYGAELLAEVLGLAGPVSVPGQTARSAARRRAS